jgi:putative redox protein
MPHSAKAVSTTTPYRVTLSDPQGHSWFADEPKDKGGSDSAPNPMQMLLSALAACTTVTLQMYAAHKQWPLSGVTADVQLQPASNATPAAGAASSAANTIVRHLVLHGDLSDEQRSRLLQVAQACPVHKLLVGSVAIDTSMD